MRQDTKTEAELNENKLLVSHVRATTAVGCFRYAFTYLNYLGAIELFGSNTSQVSRALRF